MGMAAIVLAAGTSSRMGRPKMTLAWGQTTVIGRIVQVLSAATPSLNRIIVVTGGARQEVEAAVRRVETNCDAECVYNPDYAAGEMARSLQVGLAVLAPDVAATLIVLGDQPQIELAVVDAVLDKYQKTQARIVVPSYQVRRGHPWLVHRSLWPEMLRLQAPAMLRDFLNDHASEIDYLPVDTSSILADIDTPQDYERQRPI